MLLASPQRADTAQDADRRAQRHRRQFGRESQNQQRAPSVGKAVWESFTRHAAPFRERPGAVVMRHRPQRDADNTWRTWINAMCSAGGTDQEHWAARAPLAGWRPAAIASVLDTCIDTLVLYELWHSVGPHLTIKLARTHKTAGWKLIKPLDDRPVRAGESAYRKLLRCGFDGMAADPRSARTIRRLGVRSP
jgi:hypothetical protein